MNGKKTDGPEERAPPVAPLPFNSLEAYFNKVIQLLRAGQQDTEQVACSAAGQHEQKRLRLLRDPNRVQSASMEQTKMKGKGHVGNILVSTASLKLPGHARVTQSVSNSSMLPVFPRHKLTFSLVMEEHHYFHRKLTGKPANYDLSNTPHKVYLEGEEQDSMTNSSLQKR